MSGENGRGRRGRLPDGTPNPVDVHVGQRVRIRRTLMGLSQEELGAAMGLTFQQVQKYERGGNRISASRLYDLSRILDVPIGFFFDDMPESVKAQSPSLVAGAAEQGLHLAENSGDSAMKRETLELVRNYYRIGNSAVQRQVYDLAKVLADSMNHERKAVDDVENS